MIKIQSVDPETPVKTSLVAIAGAIKILHTLIIIIVVIYYIRKNHSILYQSSEYRIEHIPRWSKVSCPHGNASSKAIESRNWRTQMVAKFSDLESIEH